MKPWETWRCADCGIGTVRLMACAGRTMHYHRLRLEVPAEIKIPTCDHCGAEWFDDTATDALEAALQPAYRAELGRRTREAIDSISRRVPSDQLEAALGLSFGELAKLRAGEREPSPELVSELALLARAPVRRVRELERFWARRRPRRKRTA